MKLLVDVEKDYYEIIKYNVEHGQEYKPFEIIANGTPYENENEWIPITFRQATDDEYKEFIRRFDDIPREECKVYDCRMPDDGQEVLVTTCGGYVCEDIFSADPDYYGFENCSDPDDAIAWMPKPKAYKKEGES